MFYIYTILFIYYAKLYLYIFIILYILSFSSTLKHKLCTHLLLQCMTFCGTHTVWLYVVENTYGLILEFLTCVNWRTCQISDGIWSDRHPNWDVTDMCESSFRIMSTVQSTSFTTLYDMFLKISISYYIFSCSGLL